MKLSVSAFRAQASAHKKILSTSWISPLTYGSTSKDQPKTTFSPTSGSEELRAMVDSTSEKSSADGHPPPPESSGGAAQTEATGGTTKTAAVTFQTDHAPPAGGEGKKAAPEGVDTPAPPEATPKSGGGLSRSDSRSNQCWMKLRTTVQLSNAIQKPKPPLKREDSFLKRFSTRQIPDQQETMDTGDEYEEGGDSSTADGGPPAAGRRLRMRRKKVHHSTVINPDSSFYFYWLLSITACVLYNLWTLIVRQSFPELQEKGAKFWFFFDYTSDTFVVLDILVQFRTGYLEQGLMVYNSMKLAGHYVKSRAFMLDIISLLPLDLLYLKIGVNPMLRFPRFFKVYRVYDYYYIVESRTVYPNLWRVVNLVHILLIFAHWFGCFYYLLSQAEGFYGDWVYPYRVGEFSTLTRKYLGSIYWSTLTLTTIGDLPQPETDVDRPKCPVRSNPENRLLYVRNISNPQYRPKRGRKSRILQYNSNVGYIFTMVSYLMGVFIFATIVGQVGNVITNRNANRLEFERLLDGAKTYMRHHKVPGGMKRRVLRWYDYSWSRGRIQGGGDINTALGLLPDKLKTELALHVNLVVLKKVTIFQECQPEFLHDLVLKMKAYIFTPGDLICRKGEVAREMFIIADGILEVISESGRVLTTMKAGDFFGEIGILNLDGLNKRTADVRSVGYAELFSLSREDVLSAMKDYPEAQEILQNLGRKRLMEAKNMNRKFKAEAERAAKSSADTTPDGDAKSTRSTLGSSSIVEKIKQDVKSLGFLRKGRLTKGRDESFELEPLTRSAGGKPKMTRMKRVCSDENSQEDETTTPPGDSKIGAGLPILARLKLLKEKEASEHLMSPTSKSSEPTAKGDFQKCLIPSIQKSIALLPSPQKSVSLIPTKKCDAEKETGDTVIGQGLPLFQRLKLLKQKEEKESRMIQETANSAAQILSSCTVRTQHAANSSQKSRRTSSSEPNKPEHEPAQKESKVSLDSKNSPKTNLVSKVRRSGSTVEKVVLHESSMLTAYQSESSASSSTGSSSQPWTKLKNATIVQSKTEELLSTGCPSTTGTTGSVSNAGTTGCPSSTGTTGSVSNTGTAGSVSNAQPLQHARVLKNKKLYNSIEDLSPEYAGLPFVKKLKILNERQKLAELESKVFTKSLSLDSGSTSTLAAIESNLDGGDLTRSNSEALAMDIVMRGRGQKREVERMKTEDTLISFESDLTEEDLILTDSNETIERQCLKSILKRISADIDEAVDNKKDLKKLMRSPTVEGYVARRSKLTKSVTFNDTFTSPPKTPMNVSPLLSPLPPTQEANTSANLTDDGKRFFNLTPITESSPSLTPVESSQSKKPLISVSDTTSVHSKAITCSTVTSEVSLLAPMLPVVNTPYLSKKSLPSQTTISTAQSEQSCSSLDTTSSKLPEYNISNVNTSPSHGSSINRIESLVTTSFSDLVTSSFPNSQSLPIASIGGQDQSHFSLGLNLNPDLIPLPNANNLEPKVNNKQKNKSKMRRKFCKKKMISNEEEYFSNILGGIKSVIEEHLYQMETKFSSHFAHLESEIRKRDLIIKRLRSQIYNSNNSVDPSPFGQDVSSSPTNENPYESENEEESENLSGEYQVMSDEDDEIPFMRDDSIDTIYCRSPPPTPNHFDAPSYKYDHPNQSRLTHQSSYSCSGQSRGNKDFNIKNWKSLDMTLDQSRVEDDQSEAELKQYAERRKVEYDKSRRLKIAEERYKLLQDQNDEILSTFNNDSSVSKQKEFFDRSIQHITLLDSLQNAENDKALQEDLRVKDKERQEYEQKRLVETINSRIEYEIKQIRSRSVDQDLSSLAKGVDKRRSWDESSALRSLRMPQVQPKAESVQIEIESDNEEIVPSEIRDVNYRSHDTNWEINMLADQWKQKQ